MFDKKPKRKSIEVTKLSSLVADNVEIVGDILFSGGLRVDGKVRGAVRCREDEKGLLVISRSGVIEGDVSAHDAVVDGQIVGDVTVDHFLELQPGARVRGNIRYRQLQLECGAVVEGQLISLDNEAVTDDKVVTLVPGGLGKVG